MNLVERLLDWERREPQRVWLCQPIDDVERRYTFAQAADEVRRAAMAIRALGLPAGRRIAISGRNTAHWLIADLAISMAGHVAVGLSPPTRSEERRVGKRCVRTCMSRGSQDHQKQKRKQQQTKT